MSKKKLERTAIEGGRTGYSKHDRRESSQIERSNVRTFIAGSHGDPEIFDEVSIPKRKKVYKDFNDKLNPVERWIDSRVGYSWNKTHSLLKTKFDSRTTAGRHIINDHILGTIWLSADRTEELAKYHRYFVDQRGILRKTPSYKEKYEKLNKEMAAEKTSIIKWMDYRMISKEGNVLYWYIPTVKYYSLKFDWYTGKYDARDMYSYPRFIKSERLSGADIQFFTKLYPQHKKILLLHSEFITSCKCNHGVNHHYKGVCQIYDCKCNIKSIVV